MEISRKKFRFRFENIWLREAGFIAEVKEVWNNIPCTHLLPKLMEVSAYMARWGRVFFHKFREKIKEKKTILERLADATDESSIQEYLAAKENLNDLLFQEETYWKQRAKLFWLAEGDENTRFFHSSATSRKKSNHIAYLLDDNNERVDSEEGMCHVVHDYFSKLFAGDSTEEDNTHMNSPRKITEAQNTQLVKDLTFEEFTLAIKQMHPDKASGPDGLNPAFF